MKKNTYSKDKWPIHWRDHIYSEFIALYAKKYELKYPDYMPAQEHVYLTTISMLHALLIYYWNQEDSKSYYAIHTILERKEFHVDRLIREFIYVYDENIFNEIVDDIERDEELRKNNIIP
jgi:hypothetical protein